MSGPGTAAAATALIEFDGAGARAQGRWLLRGITFAIAPGEMIAVIGPSGAGKSTLARLAMGLLAPSEGSVNFAGQTGERQLIYQDPQRSLDPCMTVEQIIMEGVALRGTAGTSAAEWLGRVGLAPSLGSRRPAELSGGQRQRVAIARACAVRPKLLVADEPAAALDTATASAILNLLRQIQTEFGMACVLITHQVPQIVQVAPRALILDSGLIVEAGLTHEVLAHPQHARTQALLRAIPTWPPGAQPVDGSYM